MYGLFFIFLENLNKDDLVSADEDEGHMVSLPHLVNRDLKPKG